MDSVKTTSDRSNQLELFPRREIRTLTRKGIAKPEETDAWDPYNCPLLTENHDLPISLSFTENFIPEPIGEGYDFTSITYQEIEFNHCTLERSIHYLLYSSTKSLVQLADRKCLQVDLSMTRRTIAQKLADSILAGCFRSEEEMVEKEQCQFNRWLPDLSSKELKEEVCKQNHPEGIMKKMSISLLYAQLSPTIGSGILYLFSREYDRNWYFIYKYAELLKIEIAPYLSFYEAARVILARAKQRGHQNKQIDITTYPVNKPSAWL